jgi:concentrative nucleoside transporter, CNT family
MRLRLTSLLGWAAMLLLAWGISYNRKKFPWRTVLWGLGLQFTLALLILNTGAGKGFFAVAGKVGQKLIQFSGGGTKFVFGPLADQLLTGNIFGADNAAAPRFRITATRNARPPLPPRRGS